MILDTNIRWFAEDADLLQGFQYSIDTSDAFGGLGANISRIWWTSIQRLHISIFGAGWGNTKDVKEEQGGENAAFETRLARIRR